MAGSSHKLTNPAHKIPKESAIPVTDIENSLYSGAICILMLL